MASPMLFTLFPFIIVGHMDHPSLAFFLLHGPRHALQQPLHMGNGHEPVRVGGDVIVCVCASVYVGVYVCVFVCYA